MTETIKDWVARIVVGAVLVSFARSVIFIAIKNPAAMLIMVGVPVLAMLFLWSVARLYDIAARKKNNQQK